MTNTGAVAQMMVSKVKQGEYVRFTENGPVWIRGGYDRESKTYSFTSFDDMNKERFAKGTKKVFVGFTF